MADDSQGLVARRGVFARGEGGDVVAIQMDLFMVGIEICTSRVGYAVHRSQNESDGARAGTDCLGVGVEEVEDVLDLRGEVFGAFGVGEEYAAAFMTEVVEVEAESGGGEGVFADREGGCAGGGGGGGGGGG